MNDESTNGDLNNVNEGASDEAAKAPETAATKPAPKPRNTSTRKPAAAKPAAAANKPAPKPRTSTTRKPAAKSTTAKTTAAAKSAAAPKKAEPAKPQPAAVALDDVITVREASRVFKTKEKRILKAVKSGSLPSRKSGKRRLVLREDVKALFGKGGDRKAVIEAGPNHAALEEIITLREAVKTFKVSEKKAQKAAKKGKIEARKSGKRWLVRRDEASKLWAAKGK